jgi:hypothetical protein
VSKLSHWFDVTGEKYTPECFINLSRTSVPCNAKALGLQHLNLPDYAAGTGQPDRTRVIHHRTDKLLVEQQTVSDGQAASPVKQWAKHSQFSAAFFPRIWRVPPR